MEISQNSGEVVSIKVEFWKTSEATSLVESYFIKFAK